MKVFISFILLAATLAGSALENQVATEGEDGASMQYFFVEKNDGSFVVEDLIHSEIEARAQASDMSYHFFSRKDPLKGTDIYGNNVATLANTDFSAKKKTLFITHGWVSDKDGELSKIVTKAALSSNDANIFVVDWNPVASKNYITAKNAVVNVGVYLAAFIKALNTVYGLTYDKITCAGHSLGAHICGNAGADLQGRLGHIVALDPANPLFSLSNTDNRVDVSDAQFVQVIHTNGGLLGMSESIGHIDYFPNGGKSQPGCGFDIGGGCAHARSFQYLAEALEVKSKGFPANVCPSYNDFTRGRCSSNTASLMGSLSPNTKLRGDFYLTTNSNSPFARD